MRKSDDGDLYLHTAEEVREKLDELGQAPNKMRCTEIEEQDGIEAEERPFVSQVTTATDFAFFIEGESEEQVKQILEQVGIEPDAELEEEDE
jgi:hypothetical protein